MTIPNLIAALRLLGAPVLVLVAFTGRPRILLVLFLVLEASDWLDGKLAILLEQRSELGARLDSVADMAMYASLLIALMIVEGRTFLAEWVWMAPALAGYAASWSFSLLKFGTLPSYHTWSAKLSWYFVIIAVVALLMAGDVRPLRVAAVVVTLANLEAILITRELGTPRADVRSIFKAHAGTPEKAESHRGPG